MAIEKGSIRDKNKLFQISRKRLIIGAIIFILLAICCFNFLNLLYFLVILFDALSSDFEPYALTGETKFYYYFTLSLVSVQFAFSIVYQYWLDTTKKLGQRTVHKQRSALTLQRSFNWFFFYWFFKLTFILSFLVVAMKGIDFYPDYIYLTWLFAIVFCGQTWMSLRPIFKKRFLGFLLTIALFFSSTYIVSKINLTSPRTLQAKMLGRNVMYKNNIHVPESGTLKYERIHGSLTGAILIPETNQDSLYFEGKKIHLQELAVHIFRFHEQYSRAEVPFLNYALHIDKHVKMEKVFRLKKALINMNVNRISYMFRTPDNPDPFYFRSKIGLKFRLRGNIEKDWKADPKKIVTVGILNKDRVLFKGDTLNHAEFRAQLKDDFTVNETKSFLFLMNPNTSYESYFRTLESTHKVISDFRDELALKSYGTKFSLLTVEQKNPIYEKYLWHVIDRIKE